ncbi:putative histone-like DNA-binding protein [Bacteroides heparinolyticus]|uniref:Putative histone-like DNA-binding protein n=1 Tax=Prevotella heparinolytica TaxID=28113 RepID=A0A4R2LNF5_9BACE|nr:HU family DNA-binding protein [Bacteroides heparinolyticus]TCO88585.1 putative histone-like DNA-binding protein [Bacteroides heparinolyticus]
MAEYQMQELTLPNEDGKKVLYPRMRIQGQTDLKRLAESMSFATTFASAEIIGVIRLLTKTMAWEMAQGHSVKIDGLGIFTPSLGLREGVERESGEAEGTRRNAASIRVKDINFRADKELVDETASNCTLERSARKFRRSSGRYTPEQRLKLAQDFLNLRPTMTVGDYCALTGLLRDAAARELKRWADMPGSGIGYTGRGSHKMYVRRE